MTPHHILAYLVLLRIKYDCKDVLTGLPVFFTIPGSISSGGLGHLQHGLDMVGVGRGKGGMFKEEIISKHFHLVEEVRRSFPFSRRSVDARIYSTETSISDVYRLEATRTRSKRWDGPNPSFTPTSPKSSSRLDSPSPADTSNFRMNRVEFEWSPQ